MSDSDRDYEPKIAVSSPGGAAASMGAAEPMGSAMNPSSDQANEPRSFAFDAESEAELAQILQKYPPSRRASGVIPFLYVAQAQMRRQTASAWVPRAAMDVIAKQLGMPPIRVYEVATFYLMFNTNPIGRFHLQVCGTTPCWLRGSDEVTRACRDETGIRG